MKINNNFTYVFKDKTPAASSTNISFLRRKKKKERVHRGGFSGLIRGLRTSLIDYHYSDEDIAKDKEAKNKYYWEEGVLSKAWPKKDFFIC